MLLAVAVLLALCWKTQTKLGDVFDKMRQANLFDLGVAFTVSALVHILLGAYKWHLILTGMGCRTTFVETLFVRMGSDPLRAVMPFKSGELGNVAYYWRTGRLSFSESVSWVAFDKAVNIGGTCFWLAVGLIILFCSKAPESLRAQTGHVLVGIGIVVGATAAFFAPLVSSHVRRFLIALAGRVSGKLGRLAGGVLSAFARLRPSRKLWLAILGIIFQFRPLLVLVLLFHAFRADLRSMPSGPEFLANGSVVVAFSNVPGPQWGVGFREVALKALFQNFVDPDKAADGRHDARTLIAIGLLMGFAIHFVPAFVGLPFLVQFLNALRLGKAPPLNGEDDVASGEEEGP